MDQSEPYARRRGFLGGDPFDADASDHDHESAEGVRVRTRRVRRRSRSIAPRSARLKTRPALSGRSRSGLPAAAADSRR